MANRSTIIFLLAVIAMLVTAVIYLALDRRQVMAPVSPEQIASSTPPLATSSDIIISSPQPDAVVKSPLVLEGQATGQWYFEAQFNAKLFDAAEKELGSAILTAQSDWMTENLVPFKGELRFVSPQTATGTLFFLSSNPSGLEENQKMFAVPVRFNLSGNLSRVKVFFNNSRLDPEFSCNKVFPVEREVEKTQRLATAAVTELLKGPSEADKADGFFTSIPSGVQIQSLVIENGAAKVDFNEALQAGVGGSCRVSAIRAEITETLKQFPSVREVIISINGRTEDILQP